MGRRRAELAEILLRMDGLRAGGQDFLRLDVVRIRHAAVHRADRGALFLVEVADAFGAFFRNDIVEIIRQGVEHLAVKLVLHAAGIDRGVRAFRFARAAAKTW